MLIGDYKTQVDKTSIATFFEIYELNSLISEPTWFKSL